MRTTKLFQGACMIGTSLLFVNLALAADNCTGYDILVTQSAETLDVGKGLTLTVLRQHSVLITEDAPIYNLVTGECSGTVLITPDGKARASGHCARRDKDGDTQSIEWALAPGSEQTTWKLTGGTGKFAGKTGSGWAQTVRTDDKREVVKWGGTCK